MDHHYNLGFISDEDIYTHVKKTVEAYRREITLSQFNENIIDPIKLTFDAKVYNKTIEQAVTDECFRQIDKSNTNRIGYFHQNLFRYAGNGWGVPAVGFDVENDSLHIYVEMKNKHNTMNSASLRETRIRMQGQILDDKTAICYLVELESGYHIDEPWHYVEEKDIFVNDNIRRLSIDRLYALVFGVDDAFYKVCATLPQIVSDVLDDNPELSWNYISSPMYSELLNSIKNPA